MLRLPAALLLVLTLTACAHFFEDAASPSHLAEVTSNDPALTTFYEDRANQIDQRFMAPIFHGNIVTWISPTKAKFADNTVYLGNVIAWRALSAGGPNPAAAFKKISETVRHISRDLSPPTTLPDGTANRGFFWRDDVRETSAELGGKTYQIASDAQGSGNEMSQDQIVHLLFGYSLAINAANRFPTLPEASETRALIVEHAHQIGMRLKAYNYMIVNPDGKNVARGADARGFAWPIARAISYMTGRDLSTYLDKIQGTKDSGDALVIDSSGLRELFFTALDGLSAGVCDLKVGKDHRDLCARFTLRMINAIYYASRTYETKPLYIQRMDSDGDYLGATTAKIARGDKVPERYLKELKSATGTTISSNTAPALWCRESRWIFLPTSCPEEGDDTVYNYNGIDFLTFYAALRFGGVVIKP